MLPVAPLLLAVLARAPQEPRFVGAAWPEADRLFHQDPRWLGADAAFSVPLGDGRVLWLFGDTFVATSERLVRSEARMVRNTVGIQTGLDPSQATMRFAWREEAGGPGSFFPEEGERWFWPQHGMRVGDALYLFLMRIRATPGEGLGFAADGWRVARVADAAGNPETWRLRMLAPPAPEGLIVGAALCELGEHVVALAIREPGDHAGYLVRWPRAALVAGTPEEAAFARGEWWAGSRGWVAADALGDGPVAVLADAGPESSLHHDAALGRWVHVRSLGFGATTIGLAFAAEIEGPWSEPAVVFRPPESDRSDAFVYAAKAHPELAGARLLLTYAANTLGDFATLVRDERLYWPRFVRLSPAE